MKAHFSSRDHTKTGCGPHCSTFMGNDQGHGDTETLFPIDNSFGAMSLFAYVYWIK